MARLLADHFALVEKTASGAQFPITVMGDGNVSLSSGLSGCFCQVRKRCGAEGVFLCLKVCRYHSKLVVSSNRVRNYIEIYLDKRTLIYVWLNSNMSFRHGGFTAK